MKYGLALIPDEFFIDICIKYQNNLREFFPNLHPILGKENNLPHITIFQGTWNNPDYLGLIDKLVKEVPLIVKISNFKLLDNRWLFLNIKDEDKILQQIHEKTYLEIKEHIDLTVNSHKDTSYYSEKEKLYFRRYGYRFSYDLYIPHFTLGKIDNITKKQKELVLSFTNEFIRNNNISEVKINRICYHQLGEAGSLSKEIFSKEIRKL